MKRACFQKPRWEGRVDAGVPQPRAGLVESLLPEALLALPAELAAVDALLDDAALFAPFRAHFDAVVGRPSMPIETYLRMMF